MIEINLLPEELRIKKKSIEPSQLDNIVYLIPAIIAVVILVHIYLGMVFLIRSRAAAGLELKWRQLEPQRAEVLGLKNELTAQSSDSQLVNSFLARRVLLAPKLNKLSLDLQPGIWFNSVSFNSRNLVVKASVVSLKMDEMDMINTFMENLKADKDFSSDFHSVEIGSIQRKIVGSFDIVDFTLTATIAPKG